MKNVTPTWNLQDIKGEEWKDIPGLLDYFMVSSYGRIKRLQYETQYSNGGTRMVPEMIIKPRINKIPNNYKKDHVICLCVNLWLNKKRYSYSIPRLVYDCFVSRFDTQDRNLFVICVDTDNFNVIPSNLKLVSTSEKMQRAISRSRFRSKFLDFSQEFISAQHKIIGDKISKQVTQYTRDGNKISTFSSLIAAQEATGAHVNTIARSASDRGFSAGELSGAGATLQP